MSSESGPTSVSVMVDVPSDGQVVVSVADPIQLCTLSCTSGMCTIGLVGGEGGPSGLVPFHRGTVHLTYRPPALQEGAWDCALYADGGPIAGVSAPPGAGPTSFVMRVSPGTKVFGVDIVR
jgi:hypothetical protein